MGRSQAYSKLDDEAVMALQDFRLAVGLPREIPTTRSPKLFQLGEWVDSLAPWDLYVTATFRPIVRRWGNPRGFAALESSVAKDSRERPSLGSADFVTSLASRTPSSGYVERFFDRWIKKLTADLLSRVDYFVGFEAGPTSGMNHFHALLAGEGLRHLQRTELWQWLFDNAGRSLVLPFVPAMGAGWYLAAAYVGKKQLGWDVYVGNRPLIRRRPARGGGKDVTRSADLPRDLMHNTLGRWHR